MNYFSKFKREIIISMNKILGNRRTLFIIIAVFIFLFVYGVFIRGYIKNQEIKKIEEQKQVKQEEIKESREEKLKEATFSRISFFLASPIKTSLSIPSYLEGNYRKIEEGNKMTLLYIKNPDFTPPVFYIKYQEKDKFILEAGEKKIKDIKSKKDGKTYSFSYFLYSEDSYEGDDLDGFLEVVWDMENVIINSLKTF